MNNPFEDSRISFLPENPVDAKARSYGLAVRDALIADGVDGVIASAYAADVASEICGEVYEASVGALFGVPPARTADEIIAGWGPPCAQSRNFIRRARLKTKASSIQLYKMLSGMPGLFMLTMVSSLCWLPSYSFCSIIWIRTAATLALAFIMFVAVTAAGSMSLLEQCDLTLVDRRWPRFASVTCFGAVGALACRWLLFDVTSLQSVKLDHCHTVCSTFWHACFTCSQTFPDRSWGVPVLFGCMFGWFAWCLILHANIRDSGLQHGSYSLIRLACK